MDFLNNLECSRDLNWLEGQPNGNDKQNHVVVDRSFYLNDDLDINHFCAVCSIPDTLMLTLRGACKESLLGFYFSDILKSNLFSTDTDYVPVMVEGQLVYHGIVSVDIRSTLLQ